MSAPPRPQKRDIQWADGLRGIACFLVLTAHGFQGFGMPESSFDVPFPFALPIFRLFLHGGFMAVAIFFIMSGYVCSIKPLKLSRDGKPDEARKNIASSAFRRVIRLGIPAGIATTISWFLCQMGAFNLAHTLLEWGWLYFQSPWQSPDWYTAIKDLFKAILHTWTYDGQIWSTGRNRYEQIQWTLAIELRGSLMCYLVLIVTASFTPYWRCAILVILLCWSVYWGDLLAEIPFYTGALLADMSILLSKANNSISTATSRYERINKYWPMALGIFGLLVCSYPTNHAELAAWSRGMTHLGNMVLHPQWEHRWAFSFIGSAILIFAIHFSPTLRRIFSHPYAVFFGSISFPVYLIHSFLMRSVLVWVIHGIIPKGPLLLRYLLNTAAFLGYFATVTWLSVLWRDRIDSACVLITQWVEEVMVGKRTVLGSLAGLSNRGGTTTNGNGLGNGHLNGNLEKDVKQMNVTKGSQV